MENIQQHHEKETHLLIKINFKSHRQFGSIEKQIIVFHEMQQYMSGEKKINNNNLK